MYIQREQSLSLSLSLSLSACFFPLSSVFLLAPNTICCFFVNHYK